MPVAYAPGRVNLIGEHTDYNAGLSLPFAIARGVTVTALAGGDEVVVDAPGAEVFARGVAAELGVTGGVRLSIASDLPIGAGLSSSAALCVALFLAISGDDAREAVEVARLCSRVENEWAGARTGLLDQLASLLGRAGHALRIDFRSLEVEPVPLELGDWRLVTVDSGETRELGASGYNERRAECAEAARLLGVETLRDAPVDADLPAPLDRRVRPVAEEDARVDATVPALRARDPPAGPPLPPRRRGERARRRDRRRAARRRPAGGRRAARRLALQPARPLRRVDTGGRAHGRGAARRGRGGCADGRRRLRRPCARAAAARRPPARGRARGRARAGREAHPSASSRLSSRCRSGVSRW